jgi:hypothetical protein
MTFEWDPRKAAANLRKHGVSFHAGAMVLADPLAITWPDPDHSAGEQRFITVGLAPGGRVLLVAHTDRGDRLRIISVRPTTRRERRHYEEGT